MKYDLHNIIWTLDSYKHSHPDMLPAGTEIVHSYLEARKGAMYPYSVHFGLQYVMREWLEGPVVTKDRINEAEVLLTEHFKFTNTKWNRTRWDYILNKHGGHLPVQIDSAAEGLAIPVNNIVFRMYDTDPNVVGLTNQLETVIQAYVWYASTVATRSHLIVSHIKQYFKETVDDDKQWLADYYLHDFGQRGVSCMEQAGIGGMAHLINSRGTDTVMAMPYAMKYYDAGIEDLAYSVNASEHSIMTSLGRLRQYEVTRSLMEKFPDGILSLVYDSYNLTEAVIETCTNMREEVLKRNGKLVIRPDSPRFDGDTPQDQVLWIVQQLADAFGTTTNSKGYKVLHPNVGVIYGDSLTEVNIIDILNKLKEHKFSAEACVYGCGGYLLQKLNRDTQRVAFKSCAQRRYSKWYEIYKDPTDKSKASKRGFLDLLKTEDGGYITRQFGFDELSGGLLQPTFLNGHIIESTTFKNVRKNAWVE